MTRSSPDTMMPASVEPSIKEIPYDHVATFDLQGKAGNRVQDVINISTDGAFVAVAIGYSFIPASPLKNAEAIDVEEGLNFLDPFVMKADDDDNQELKNLKKRQKLQLVQLLAQCLLVRLCGIDFKYSIVDSGSGRELQNKQIHNIAGLGRADGDRPFRPLAKPMLYMPRSTIRIEVEEVSEGSIYSPAPDFNRTAQLFIVLHGYKLLGYGTGLP
jgi:hypothetical protein